MVQWIVSIRRSAVKVCSFVCCSEISKLCALQMNVGYSSLVKVEYEIFMDELLYVFAFTVIAAQQSYRFSS